MAIENEDRDEYISIAVIIAIGRITPRRVSVFTKKVGLIKLLGYYFGGYTNYSQRRGGYLWITTSKANRAKMIKAANKYYGTQYDSLLRCTE